MQHGHGRAADEGGHRALVRSRRGSGHAASSRPWLGDRRVSADPVRGGRGRPGRGGHQRREDGTRREGRKRRRRASRRRRPGVRRPRGRRHARVAGRGALALRGAERAAPLAGDPVTSRLPFGWLRGLAAALRRWVGKTRAARARWQRHEGPLAASSQFTLWVPPLPPALPDAPPSVRAALEAAAVRLATGQAFGALGIAAELGAEIYARLEDGTAERRPALLVVTPVPQRER